VPQDRPLAMAGAISASGVIALPSTHQTNTRGIDSCEEAGLEGTPDSKSFQRLALGLPVSYFHRVPVY